MRCATPPVFCAHGAPCRGLPSIRPATAPFADQIRALPAGQAVRLNWVHEYVTLEDEEGRKTSPRGEGPPISVASSRTR